VSGYQKNATSKGAGKWRALPLFEFKNEKTAIRKGFRWRLGRFKSNVGFGEELLTYSRGRIAPVKPL